MSKLDILYIGHLNTEVRAYQRYKALCDLGLRVTPLSSVPASRTYYYKSNIIDRILWKLSIPRDITGVNKVIKNIEYRNYPIVWIDKGNTIKPSTLKFLKYNNPNVKIISFAEDDMFVKHNRSFYYRKCLKYYDYIFTTKSYNADFKELPSLGAKNVIFIGNAFDQNFHRPISLTKEDIDKYSTDVGFIGTYEKDRADSILYLASKGVRITVWGKGWEKINSQFDNLKINNKALFGEEYIKCIGATKINLGFLRKINRDLQTARSVEIPACNAFMLAERTEEHMNLYREGVEAEFFSSDEELFEKVMHYLENDEIRKEISLNGYKRSIDHYSHHSRLKTMLSYVIGE